jgi:hypothetical protein
MSQRFSLNVDGKIHNVDVDQPHGYCSERLGRTLHPTCRRGDRCVGGAIEKQVIVRGTATWVQRA